MKMCKAMMGWVNARIDYEQTEHNAKFHTEQLAYEPKDFKKILGRLKGQEKKARNKLFKMM